MFVAGDQLDVDLRHVPHTHDRVVVEVGLLNSAVVDTDFLGQCKAKAVQIPRSMREAKRRGVTAFAIIASALTEYLANV
jgi:hypothetical protein